MTNLISEKESRAKLIQTIQTPLGFFSLVVLVVEVILGISANLSSGRDKTYLIFGMIGIIILLILIVTGLAIFLPTSLYGKNSKFKPKKVTNPLLKEAIANSEVRFIKNHKFLFVDCINGGLEDQRERIFKKLSKFSKIKLIFNPTADSFQNLLIKNKFDIIQLDIHITSSSKLFIELGNGLDSLTHDCLIELLEISETKLLVIASCQSVLLASKLSSKVNMIAFCENLSMNSSRRWENIFYELLGQGFPLSRAYSAASTSIKTPIAIIMKEDIIITK